MGPGQCPGQVIPFSYCSWKVRVMVVIRIRVEGLETVGSSVARCSLNLCDVLLILHSCQPISHLVHHCEYNSTTVLQMRMHNGLVDLLFQLVSIDPYVSL